MSQRSKFVVGYTKEIGFHVDWSHSRERTHTSGNIQPHVDTQPVQTERETERDS